MTAIDTSINKANDDSKAAESFGNINRNCLVAASDFELQVANFVAQLLMYDF